MIHTYKGWGYRNLILRHNGPVAWRFCVLKFVGCSLRERAQFSNQHTGAHVPALPLPGPVMTLESLPHTEP